MFIVLDNKKGMDKERVNLTRLNGKKEIIEIKEIEFNTFHGNYYHPLNKKGIRPLKTSLGDYLTIDYKLWYITSSLNRDLLKEVD